MQTFSPVRHIALLMAVLGQAATVPVVPERQRPLFAALDVNAAWQVTRGAGVRVGIVDVGFDFDHPALKTALEPGYFAPGVFHSPASSIVAHGTAVAGLIGARSAEGPPVIGLAPECQMIAAARGMPEHTLLRLQRELTMDGQPPETLAARLQPHAAELKAFQQRWLRYVAETTAAAIEYLVSREVRVINISENLPLGAFAAAPDLATRLETAFATAERHDVVVVLGAGNADARVERYPGNAKFVAVIGAAAADGHRWVAPPAAGGSRQGSSFGPGLTVIEPMENLLVARPHEPAFYRLLDSPIGPVDEPFAGAVDVVRTGATSLATAVATGLVTLIRSANPQLRAADVIAALERGATDLDTPGRDDWTGFGRIHFGRTMALVQSRSGR